MSFLQRVREANRHDPRRYVPFLIARRRYGAVTREFADRLASFPHVFRVDRDDVRLAGDLDSDRAAPDDRTAAVAEVFRRLRSEGELNGWRDELYPVCARWGETPAMLVERAAAPRLGVRAFSVHMNALVGDARRMWIAKRAAKKPTFPGALDQLVAGGQPHGLGLRENLVKECEEEAGIPTEIARRAKPAGVVSYVHDAPEGLKPDVIYVFDLVLPEDFEPSNRDGEVESFHLWPIDRVAATVRDTTRFKFNCALVIVDFLVRAGFIDPEFPDYERLVEEMRGSPGWCRR